MTARQAVRTSARNCEIRGGEYVAFDRANYATALKVWLPLAEGGDPAAQTYVGEIFEKGLGVPPDHAAAAQWYRRAADRGHSRAAINLGNLYEQGLGVPKDPVQALNWYRKAAGLGSVNFEIVPGKTAAELQELRTQIAELRGQLQAKQAELERAQSELEKLRRSLEERRSEAQTERAALERLRRQLDEQRGTGQTAAARIAELQRSIADSEARLKAKEGEVASLRASVTRAEGDSTAQRTALDREVSALRDRLARAESESSAQRAGLQRIKEEMAQAGPRIELVQVQLVEPPAASGDAKPAVTSPAAAPAMTAVVVGRVTAAAGVKSFAVNQREQPLDKDNLFRAQVPLADAERRVQLVAVDTGGRTSRMEFVLPAIDAKSREKGVATMRGPQPEAAKAARPRPSFGGYHALVIGNNGYRQMPALRTAVNDARAVAALLKEQYRFQVTLLIDANRYEILSALNTLREKLTSKDNLLIYYAGHGIVDAKNQRGYWLPVDAEPNSTANWIPNSDITSILNIMNVKQLLLVADSCYSGTLTRSAAGQLESGLTEAELDEVIQRMAQQRSRMVMTSGGLEPVLDSVGGAHSAFADVFLQVLRDNRGLLLGREAFRRVQLRVAAMAERLSIPQVPEYAPIQFAGHEAGDFVFVR